MGFIAILSFSGITTSCYATISGTVHIVKDAVNGTYAINYTLRISVEKNGPPLLQAPGLLTVSSLPANVWDAIYTEIKMSFDPNYGTPSATIVFTDI